MQGNSLADHLTARVVARLGMKPRVWDSFAEQCGSSTRSTYGHIAGWSLKNVGRYKVRLLEIFEVIAGTERKIGQCAVGIGRGRRSIFLDRLQLLEPSDDVWTAAMHAVLSQAGPGGYEYGWVLNLELPQEPQLAKIPGVLVEGSWPLIVQAVDFSHWSDWDGYYHAISENSRRNEKAALRDMPNLRLDTRAGPHCLGVIPSLIELRSSTSLRKGLRHSKLGSAASYIATILCCPRYMFTSIAWRGDRPLSCFYGATFGSTTYYLEGGSSPDNRGAAWHLLISMLRQAYERAPKGKFVMGYIDPSSHRDEVGGGLLRSRGACRVKDYPTSVVDFEYAPS